MTVPNENYRNDAIGNGAASVFPYTFKIYDQTHIKVVTADTAGVETILTLTTDYTVSGVGDDAGGNVTLVAGALASGYKIANVRNPPITQLTDWQNQGRFNAEDNERAFDLVVMLVQWVRSMVARCMSVPETLASTVSAALPAPVAASVLRWNAAGTALENLATGSVTLAVPADQSVTSVKMANMAQGTAKGRPAGAGTGVPSDLTGTQLAAIVDAMVGDSGAGGTKGQAPAPAQYDANKQRVLKASGVFGAVPRIRDAARNLVMAYASASTATVTADEIVVSDGTDYAVIPNVSFTLDIVAGANALNHLDSGAEAASTWYHAWVVYNPTTGAHGGHLSLSATAPTTFGSYTMKAYVGAIRNDASSNFVRFIQRGKSVACALTAVYTNLIGVTSYATQSLSAQVPTTAAVASGVAGRSATTGGSAIDGVAVAADVNGVGAAILSFGLGGASMDGFFSGAPFRVPLITAQQVAHKMSGTGAVYGMSISGWEYA